MNKLVNLHCLSMLAFIAMRCNFVVTVSSLLCTVHVSLKRCCCRDGLSSSCITHLHRYYATIRLPKQHQLFLLYYRLFNLLSSLKDRLGSPELPLILNVQHAMLYNPETALCHLSLRFIEWWLPEGVLCRPVCVKKITRLNHFS